jgi:hypothetical protein
MVIAVGSPRAASSAKDGPLSAPIRGAGMPSPLQTCAITSVMRSREFSSNPLVALTIMVPARRCGRICSNRRRQCCDGITLTTIAAPASASARSEQGVTQAGMGWPGRNFSFKRFCAIDSYTSFS